MATLTQEQINNYKRMGVAIPAGTTVYGSTTPVASAPKPTSTPVSSAPTTSYSAPSTGSSGGSSSVLSQIQDVSAQIADLQAQQNALKQYNLTDTNQLTKTSSGSYAPTTQSTGQNLYQNGLSDEYYITEFVKKYPTMGERVSAANQYGLNFTGDMQPAELLKVAKAVLTGKSATPVQTPSAPTTQNADVLAQAQQIKNQIADLQAQSDALKQYGLTDTNQLTKDVSGNYVPSSNDILLSIQNLVGAQTNDTRTQMANLIKQIQDQQKTYLDTLANQKTPEQLYSEYSQQLGVTEKQKGITDVKTKIQETNNLIDNLERNITSRLQSADVNVTEAQRLRQMQAEQKPYQEQLRTQTQQLSTLAPEYESTLDALQQMLQLAQSGQSMALETARAPMEMSAQLLPYYQSLMEYQSPQEQLAQQIAAEQAMKERGLGSYAKSTEPVEQWSEPFAYGSNYYQQNQSTGELKSIGSISSGGGTSSELWSEPFVLGGEYVQQNMKTGAVKSVANVGKVAQTSSALMNTMASQLTNINDILADQSTLSKISNKTIAARLPLYWENMDTKEVEMLSKIGQIISQETLNGLIDAKNAGATFGALSNEELRMLADSATALAATKVENNRGQLLGFKASKDYIESQLKIIQEKILKAIGGTLTSGSGSIPFKKSSGSSLGFSSAYGNQTSSGTSYKIIQ